MYKVELSVLIDRFITQAEYQAAIQRAQQLVRSNPLLEEAHGRLIWLYAQSGQREAALNQFEQCRELLRQELAVEPTPELLALYEQALAGQVGGAAQPAAAVGAEDLRQPAVFVGREPELDQLRYAWRATRQGQSSVVLLEAEAGGGKTRLIAELARSLPEALLLAGECYESARSLPYHPWIECLETYLSRLDDATLTRLSSFSLNQLTRLLPTLARRLDRTASAGLPVGRDQTEYLFTAVTELLFYRPALIFIDNLQWADEATLELFHFVARRIPRARALLIGAYRTEEAGDVPALQTLLRDLGRRPLLRLTLASLSAESISQLIAQLWPNLPDGYRPHVSVTLSRATAGNPLFVTELLRELAHTTTTPETLPVPHSVRELVQRRLRRLPDSSRQVIEAAAVLDAPATSEQVQQTSGRSQDETVRAIDLGLRRNLLRPFTTEPPVRYEFSHDLVREAIVSQLSDIRRRLLHRRTAVTLAQSGVRAATLAYHWGKAGELEEEGHYAALAGEEAAGVYANDDAVKYLQRALELVTDTGRKVTIMSQLGQVWIITGERDQAERIYRQALAIAEEEGMQTAVADCLLRLGLLMRLNGLYDDALQWFEKAGTLYETLKDQAGMAEVSGELGMVYWYKGDHASAMDHLQRRLDLANEAGDERSAGLALANMGIVYWGLGDFERALTCFEQKLKMDEKEGDRLSMSKAYGNMGIVYSRQGKYAQALACYEQKLHIDTELGDREGMSIVLTNIGILYRR